MFYSMFHLPSKSKTAFGCLSSSVNSPQVFLKYACSFQTNNDIYTYHLFDICSSSLPAMPLYHVPINYSNSHSVALLAAYALRTMALHFLLLSSQYIPLPTIHHFPALCEIAVNKMPVFELSYPTPLSRFILRLQLKPQYCHCCLW